MKYWRNRKINLEKLVSTFYTCERDRQVRNTYKWYKMNNLQDFKSEPNPGHQKRLFEKHYSREKLTLQKYNRN